VTFSADAAEPAKTAFSPAVVGGPLFQFVVVLQLPLAVEVQIAVPELPLTTFTPPLPLLNVYCEVTSPPLELVID